MGTEITTSIRCRFALICGIALCAAFSSLFLALPDVLAHGGHGESKESELTPAPEPEKNIYAVEGESDPAPEADLPPMDLLESHDTQAPAEHSEPHDHKMMPKIKMAAHEWVSTSQKGYTAAAGITVLAGLIFGVLSFTRPNE